MLALELIIGLSVLVLQFPMEPSMPATAQSLVVCISMHVIEFIVIVLVPILKAVMPLGVTLVMARDRARSSSSRAVAVERWRAVLFWVLNRALASVVVVPPFGAAASAVPPTPTAPSPLVPLLVVPTVTSLVVGEDVTAPPLLT